MQNASIFQFLFDVIGPNSLPKAANYLRNVVRNQDVGTEAEVGAVFP